MCGAIAAVIGSAKNRSVFGSCRGTLLGLIGIFSVADHRPVWDTKLPAEGYRVPNISTEPFVHAASAVRVYGPPVK